MARRVYRTGIAAACGVAALVVAGTAGAQPGGVNVTPGDDYGITVYSTDPGSPGSGPATSHTDVTAGTGQPSTLGTQEWTEWSNSGQPYLCNPQTCLLPLAGPGVPATPREVVDPLTVAQELVTGMQIRRIDIGIVPEDSPGRVGLIGMPVWLWDETLPPESEHTRGPITRTASVGALTVSATAINVAITWNLGDGGLPVVCPAPTVNNMPYLDVYMDLPPITGCGRFAPGWRKTSIHEPGGVFTVSATSLWLVTWFASGPSGTVGGTFPLLPTATTTVRVGEMQVLGVN
ncbi:hypothetical protein [Nocardia sp. IFM 10818]